MFKRVFLLALCLAAWPVGLWAAAAPRNLVNTESPVSARCVTADGTAYESCAGSASGGDGKILDGTAAGQADVKATDPTTTDEGLVTRSLNYCDNGAGGLALCTQPVAGSGGTSSSFGAAFPATGTAVGFSDGTNMRGPLVFDTDTGVGTEYTLGVVIRLPGAGGSVVGGTATDPLRIDPTGTTTQPVSQGGSPWQVQSNSFNLGTETTLSALNTKIPSQGQALKAASVPVTLASDQGSIGTVQLEAGTNAIGKLAANSGVDIGDVDVLSLPTATVQGANSNAKINCTANAFLNMTTATTTQIVALSGSTTIYVCSYSIVSNGGTASTVKFVRGTGTNCATGTADVSSGVPLTAATNTVGIARGGGEGMILKTAGSDALCVTSSGAATLGVDISYTQF